MKQKIYQVDAFADKLFSGNPAAVCPLHKWLSDELMQSIAMENNLAETAFYVKKEKIYELRWFTPEVEVDLCGHATLAAAFVLFNCEGVAADAIHFHSPRSGRLSVTRNGDWLTLDFPSDKPVQVSLTQELCAGFNLRPVRAMKGKTDYVLVFDTEEEVKSLLPSFEIIAKTEARGVIVTAKGDDVDFVSRFFGPRVGVNEDPVTGSAHTTLTPMWAELLGKTDLKARQLSRRGGDLICRNLGDRVQISGKARLYMEGTISVE